MKQLKITKSDDGVVRRWFYDSEKGVILYKGLAGDFRNKSINFSIKNNLEDAQKLIDSC